MNIQRVFVSSVMRGYEDRREAARQAILELGMTPILAEDLIADPNPPREVVLDKGVRNCDAVVAIYGKRYGWTGPKSGFSPTEEEYIWAQDLSKPIYAFIDRMQRGEPEPQQEQFLQKVQNWDTGITRNEFHSLKELKEKIKQALTGSALSPRYRTFLTKLPACAEQAGYDEYMPTRLPAFDLLLHREPQSQHEQDMLIAVTDGDRYDRQQITHISSLWRTALAEHFQTGFWRAKYASGVIHGMFRAPPGRYSSPKSQFRFPEPFQACQWPKVSKMGLQEPKSGFLPQIAVQKRNRLFRRDLSR